MKKGWFYIAGAAFVLFLGWRIAGLVLKTQDTQSNRGRPPIAVEIDSVRIEPIQEIRRFTGTIYPLYKYIVASKTSGRIISIKNRIGDWVQKGEVIAQIEDAEYQQSVREAEANLRIARSALVEANSQFELARQELERVESLQQKGIASPAELDAATSSYTAQESRLELARAQVEQRQAALTSAQIRLGYTTLLTTQPGFIGERYVDEGALLSPNAPVVSVVGIDKVFVQTTIIERDYGRIHPGQACQVEVDAYSGQVFTGQVARIAPVLEEASRVAKMELEVDNKEHLLKPGMFARISIVLSQNDQALTVPSNAVVDKNGKSGVFILNPDEKAVRYVPVTVGIVSSDRTEIITPKINGIVVTLGQHLLEDGSPVILPVAASATGGTETSSGFQKESRP
ncbi:efflux RND transporter periplasmic adaptor subunit [candidate division KSB1 bacterium]|nr:efflux RND transporter periplasmic adaptor subunit [candidate division KSB1 bacterium]